MIKNDNQINSYDDNRDSQKDGVKVIPKYFHDDNDYLIGNGIVKVLSIFWFLGGNLILNVLSKLKFINGDQNKLIILVDGYCLGFIFMMALLKVIDLIYIMLILD